MASDPPVLLIEGEAGMGKSSLWREAMSQAQTHGLRTLDCSATEAEAKLAFTVVRDLLGEAYEQVRGALPPPQRRALAVTLTFTHSSVDIVSRLPYPVTVGGGPRRHRMRLSRNRDAFDVVRRVKVGGMLLAL